MIRLRHMVAITTIAMTMTAFQTAYAESSIIEFPATLKPVSSVRAEAAQSLRSYSRETPKKAPARVSIPGVISELPEGAEYFDYNRDGVGFYYLYGSVSSEYLVARQSEIYICGSDVYLKNPVIELPTDTYIKGTLTEEGMTFELPQPITAYEWDGIWYYTYASMLDLGENPETGNLSYFKPGNDEENRLVLYRDSENPDKFAMDKDYGNLRILGTIDDYDYWSGYGEYDVIYTPFNTPLVTPPADLKTENYIVAWKTASARMVEIGIDGTECYVKGLSRYAPEGWIKGEYLDEKIVLKSGQYVGINYDWDLRSRLFFKGAHIGPVWSEYYGDYIDLPIADEEVVLSYDSATRTYSTEGVIGFTTGDAPDAVFYEYYIAPSYRFQPADISLIPAKPIFKDYYPLSSMDGQCLHFIIPDLNVDGYLLPHDDLYYRIWVNGEPYVWEQTEYPTIPEPTMEWMPVDMDDFWDFMTHEDYISIVVYVEGMETFGVQSSFYDGGQRYESEVMTFRVDDPTSIEDLDGASIKAVKYYDMSGREVASPESGIYIKKIIFEDNTVKTFKTAVR